MKQYMIVLNCNLWTSSCYMHILIWQVIRTCRPGRRQEKWPGVNQDGMNVWLILVNWLLALVILYSSSSICVTYVGVCTMFKGNLDYKFFFKVQVFSGYRPFNFPYFFPLHFVQFSLGMSRICLFDILYSFNCRLFRNLNWCYCHFISL